MLAPDDIDKLMPAESTRCRSPTPTQSVSSDEFLPAAQSPRQREFQAPVMQLGSELARKAGTQRMFSHAIFMPGMPGWLDRVEYDLYGEGRTHLRYGYVQAHHA